jgi:hypothetical protein
MGPTADAAAPTDARLSAPVETVIDLAHLGRMTLGERSLEAEVLTLFDRQADVLLARMRDCAPAAVVAAAADAVEMNVIAANAGGVAGAVARLSAAVDEAKAVIADRLQPRTGF